MKHSIGLLNFFFFFMCGENKLFFHYLLNKLKKNHSPHPMVRPSDTDGLGAISVGDYFQAGGSQHVGHTQIQTR